MWTQVQLLSIRPLQSSLLYCEAGSGPRMGDPEHPPPFLCVDVRNKRWANNPALWLLLRETIVSVTQVGTRHTGVDPRVAVRVWAVFTQSTKDQELLPYKAVVLRSGLTVNPQAHDKVCREGSEVWPSLFAQLPMMQLILRNSFIRFGVISVYPVKVIVDEFGNGGEKKREKEILKVNSLAPSPIPCWLELKPLFGLRSKRLYGHWLTDRKIRNGSENQCTNVPNV